MMVCRRSVVWSSRPPADLWAFCVQMYTECPDHYVALERGDTGVALSLSLPSVFPSMISRSHGVSDRQTMYH